MCNLISHFKSNILVNSMVKSNHWSDNLLTFTNTKIYGKKVIVIQSFV